MIAHAQKEFRAAKREEEAKNPSLANHQDFAHHDQLGAEIHQTLQPKVYQKRSLIINQNHDRGWYYFFFIFGIFFFLFLL